MNHWLQALLILLAVAGISLGMSLWAGWLLRRQRRPRSKK